MAPPQVCASVLSVVVLPAAQRVSKQITSPKMSDMTLRALGASSVQSLLSVQRFSLCWDAQLKVPEGWWWIRGGWGPKCL